MSRQVYEWTSKIQVNDLVHRLEHETKDTPFRQLHHRRPANTRIFLSTCARRSKRGEEMGELTTHLIVCIAVFAARTGVRREERARERKALRREERGMGKVEAVFRRNKERIRSVRCIR